MPDFIFPVIADNHIRDRFVAKIIKQYGCWAWRGGRDKAGYGFFWYEGRMQRAHRIAWRMFRGDLASRAVVMHKCDHPWCVNPKHLRVGTARDNAQDMLQKGRANKERGEARYNAKLTKKIVRACRAAYARGGVTLTALAARHNVSKVAMRNAVRGDRWAHV